MILKAEYEGFSQNHVIRITFFFDFNKKLYLEFQERKAGADVEYFDGIPHGVKCKI